MVRASATSAEFAFAFVCEFSALESDAGSASAAVAPRVEDKAGGMAPGEGRRRPRAAVAVARFAAGDAILLIDFKLSVDFETSILALLEVWPSYGFSQSSLDRPHKMCHKCRILTLKR